MAIHSERAFARDHLRRAWSRANRRVQPGQICFIQQGFGHYVEQVGNEPTKFFVLFNSPAFEEISISKWLAGNPASLLADNFRISKEDVAKLPRKTLGIIR